MGINLSFAPFLQEVIASYVFFSAFASLLSITEAMLDFIGLMTNFLRFISYVLDYLGGSVYVFWLFPHSFSCPWHINRLNQSHRMGNIRNSNVTS